MDRLHTFFGLKLSFQVFSAMEQLSRTLEYSDINAKEATLAATKALHFLRRQRSEQSFVLFYHATVEQAKDLTQTPYPDKGSFHADLMMVPLTTSFSHQRIIFASSTLKFWISFLVSWKGDMTRSPSNVSKRLRKHMWNPVTVHLFNFLKAFRLGMQVT